MTRRDLILIASAASIAAPKGSNAANHYTQTSWGRKYRLPVGVADDIAVLGSPPPLPRKTAIIVYQGSQTTLTVNGTAGYDLAQALVADDWTVCSVNAPSHANCDLFTGEPTQISGWAWRYANGHTLFELGYLQRPSLALDILSAEGYTDISKSVIIGISRGGLLACHAAANDTRIRNIVAINPATELLFLNPWFNNHPEPAACAREDVSLLADQLASKSIYWTVNANDQVISRDAVERSYNACRDAANPSDIYEPDHRLSIVGAPGHRTPSSEYPIIISWMNKRVSN